MFNYRRAKVAGATYFITQVTHHRQPWLISDIARHALRAAITHVRQKYPFTIDAFVLLPDHFHCLWTLPFGDSDLSTRMRLIKTFVTKKYGNQLEINAEIFTSRQKRQARNLWQRRFWEHYIRDEKDFIQHIYIHYNPVKHGFVKSPKDWEYSSFHRYVKNGLLTLNWDENEAIYLIESIGHE